MKTMDYEKYIFIIRFKNRFINIFPRKDKKIVELLPNVNYVENYARYCFNSFKRVEEVKVTNMNGGFVLLYAE